MRRLIAFLAIITLLVAACGQTQNDKDVAPSAEAAEPVQQVDVELNDLDFSDLDSLDQDLDFSDLDSLDQDLNFG